MSDEYNTYGTAYTVDPEPTETPDTEETEAPLEEMPDEEADVDDVAALKARIVELEDELEVLKTKKSKVKPGKAGFVKGYFSSTQYETIGKHENGTLNKLIPVTINGETTHVKADELTEVPEDVAAILHQAKKAK